jgi:large subunit ribosomal protein L24
MATNPKNKVSSQPRKQRRAYYKGPIHTKKRSMRAHVSDELLKKYNVWTVRVHKGDTVKVMRGGYAGHTAKVTTVDTKKRVLFIEKVTSIKADGKETPRPIHPSNVLITKIDLTDLYRKKKLEESSD